MNGRELAHGTWLDDESLAYGTYAGGHSRSRRRGRAIYPDGKVRAVTAGCADTFFTIPAHGRIAGRYVSGWLTVDDRRDAVTGDDSPTYGALIFTPYKRYTTEGDNDNG